MKLIKQPTRFTCGATCACMITNTKIQDYYNFHNYDGTHPHHFEEIFQYMAHHNWWSMPFIVDNGYIPSFNGTSFLSKFFNKICLVFAEIERPEGKEYMGGHMMVWDGKRLIDPERPTKRIELDTYNIKMVWAVAKYVKMNTGKGDNYA